MSSSTLKFLKNYVTKLERSYEISLRFQVPKLSVFTSITSKAPLSSNLFSLFPPSTKINHFFPPKESCKNKFSKIQIENYPQKEIAK
jgi:hypothetical protein